MDTNRRRIGKIPFPCEMTLQGFIGEYTGRAYFHQVTTEFAFKHAILIPSKIYPVG
jgi:hypothetical protein